MENFRLSEDLSFRKRKSENIEARPIADIHPDKANDCQS